ncbi:MAG: DUF1735 domain-containing protein [Prevotellaceae bacterium]|jgi:hypothetical protein|nr:DUF1735 domain-containing protein [Prevotellaceae bacterium]
MKRKYIIAGLAIALCACTETKYDLENLVPDRFHKILYINNSGKQAVTLFDTSEDFTYALSVFKGGSDPNQIASAHISLLTPAELDEQYSTPEGKNYQIIPQGSYTIESNEVNFTVADHYKTIGIALKPQAVKQAVDGNPEALWVLPLLLTSDTDSVNANKNELFLQIADIIMPAMGFVNNEVNIKQYTVGAVSTLSEKAAVSLDMENKWDITCRFAVDDDYITAYNQVNGTLFQPLPAALYTLPESLSLPAGTTSSNLTVPIDATTLSPGDYMLPIRITEVSQFSISPNKVVYPLAIRIMGNELNRAGWSAEANTEEPSGEGAGNGVAGCILDGNLSTYWHSQWNGGNHSLPHEIIVDAKQEYTFTQFAMSQRQNTSYTDTGGGEFLVSSDKVSWVKAGDFSMQKILDQQIFSVIPTKGRYFMIRITRSNRDLNCSLSEVYAYGIAP